MPFKKGIIPWNKKEGIKRFVNNVKSEHWINFFQNKLIKKQIIILSGGKLWLIGEEFLKAYQEVLNEE